MTTLATPNANPAPPPAPAPPKPEPAPATGSGSGDRMQYLEAEVRKLVAERDEFKAKARGLEDSNAAKALEELQSQNEALQAQLEEKAAAEAKAAEELKERDRLERRRQFVDTVLSRVSDEKRGDFELMLAGLEQKGEVVIPDEEPVKGAEEAITKLADRYPGYFDAGGGGPTTPAGPGGGPLPDDFMALSPEQQQAMSQEEFEQNYGAKSGKRRRTGLFG